MRAVDMPDGEYWFGPAGTGERVRKLDGVGVTVDGTALASGAMGMDHCVRTMHRDANVPLPEAVRMASLTPARILGVEDQSRQPRARQACGSRGARRGTEREAGLRLRRTGRLK